MAVTFRPNQMKLKTQDGTYTSPVIISDITVEEHVAQVEAAITSAAEDQMDAIEAKGKETLESIPDDYTELSDSVADLKSATDYIGPILATTTPIGTYNIPFEFKKDHTYIVINNSASGALSCNLRLTADGENLQTVFNLNAGTVKEFKANQDANILNGWVSVAQTFILIDKDSRLINYDRYANDIKALAMVEQPIRLNNGYFVGTGGELSPNAGYSYTDYIDCSLTGKLRVVSEGNRVNYCAWYDENKANGKTFQIPDGDNTLNMPEGYKYCRLSSTTAIMENVKVYGAVYLLSNNAANTANNNADKLKKISYSTTATRATGGILEVKDFQLVKGHSYLLINPNDFVCSFTPKSESGDDSPLGSTTVGANSTEMRVADVDGYASVWFSNDNGSFYVMDITIEPQRKGIVDSNKDAINAIQSSKYINSDAPHLLTLVHFTDVHGDHTGLARLVEFNDEIGSYVDDVICTGDIVSAKFDDSMSFWTQVEGAERILPLVLMEKDLLKTFRNPLKESKSRSGLRSVISNVTGKNL